jgi:arabinan endo-1,5-alpha-L-arabinosidase
MLSDTARRLACVDGSLVRNRRNGLMNHSILQDMAPQSHRDLPGLKPMLLSTLLLGSIFGCSGAPSSLPTPAGSGRASVGGVGPGGSTASRGGAGTSGGMTGIGGFSGNGGTSTTVNNSGASNLQGGARTTATGGAQAVGGNAIIGGSSATGGTNSSATGGSKATGGASGVGGSSATGGSKATGGASSVGGGATGGSNANGGTTATTGGTTTTGGTSSTGGSSSAGGSGGDYCDVGVYDAATPPTSLAITNGDNVHDPSVIQVDSTFYLFNGGLWTRTSTNLTSWGNISQVLYPNPSWTSTYNSTSIGGDGLLWAPGVAYFGGNYHLYYAVSVMGSKTSCIGHATRASMTSGSWTDDGAPAICTNVASMPNSSVNWNALDPSVTLDPSGNPWLVFGSGWDGIQVVQLTSSGAVDSASAFSNIARRSGANVIEQPAMVRRCGYYYLFTSWDACCQGANSTYNIRVGRSTSMTSGFVDKSGVALTSGGGTLLISGDGTTWAAAGGQSVLFVGTKAYLVYHAYYKTTPASGAAFALRISDLYWDSDGWPVTTATP